MAPLQGFMDSHDPGPRALPWAIVYQPFGLHSPLTISREGKMRAILKHPLRNE